MSDGVRNGYLSPKYFGLLEGGVRPVITLPRSLIRSFFHFWTPISSNFFYTVTLPCTLWFLDKGKAATDRKEEVLFIDARHIFRQIDRAHRDFTPAQIEFLANIVRLYRGEKPEYLQSSEKMLAEKFPDREYADVAGLCKVATLKNIEDQGWSLNPGRYVGVADRAPDDFDFKECLEELNEELETLNAEAHELEERIAGNTQTLLSI